MSVCVLTLQKSKLLLANSRFSTLIFRLNMALLKRIVTRRKPIKTVSKVYTAAYSSLPPPR